MFPYGVARIVVRRVRRFATNQYSAIFYGVSQASRPTKSEVAKFVSLLKRYCNKEYGENIWQTSYNDHIIRNEKDYIEAIQYIENNPLRLKLGYSRK